MSWTGFAAIFVAFFLTHSVPVRPAVKASLIGTLGSRVFGIGYSVLSIAMLALLIWSAGEAPYLQLWPQKEWQRHAAQMGMFAVCIILALSVARPNPFSLGGARNEQFDATRPGIIRWTRHPILMALAIWAVVHLLPNGDLAHVMLFGVLGSFALAGRSLIDRRKKRDLGPEAWNAINSVRDAAPRIHAPYSWVALLLRLLVGVLVYAVLILAHPQVIGVSAL